MTNVDERAARFLARLVKLETEKRERGEDIRELMIEAKSAGLLKEELAALKLAARRHFETNERRVFRESVEDFAASLGQLSGTPLAASRMRRARWLQLGR